MNSIDDLIEKLSSRLEKLEKKAERLGSQIRVMFAEHDAVIENTKEILKLAKQVKENMEKANENPA